MTTETPCTDARPPLAVIDGIAYQYLAGVFALSPDGTARPYCDLITWPESPAGQTAERRLRMEALRIELARLEAEEAQWRPQLLLPPAIVEVAPEPEPAGIIIAPIATTAITVEETLPATTPAPAEPTVCPRCGHTCLTAHGLSIHLAACKGGQERAVCPHCGKQSKSAHGLSIHMASCYARRRKAEPAAEAPAPPAPARLIIASDDEIRAKQRALEGEYTVTRYVCASCGSEAFAPSISDPTRCVRCASAQRTNGHTTEALEIGA